jgi:putative hydrolase of the HAD superfamily
MSIALKAVIFDYGNVLCAPQPREDVAALAAVFDAPIPAYEEAYWEKRDIFDAAGLTPEEYWSGVARRLGRTLTDSMLEQATSLDNRSWSHASPVMARWAGAIRAAGIRTAILSNMPITLRTHLDEHVPWLPAFDHHTFSCDLRMAKPRREIFEHCIAGLGAAPGETIFLDDREENTRAAAATGLHTLLFHDPEQAQCEMNGRFELPVPIVTPADYGGAVSPSR